MVNISKINGSRINLGATKLLRGLIELEKKCQKRPCAMFTLDGLNTLHKGTFVDSFDRIAYNIKQQNQRDALSKYVPLKRFALPADLSLKGAARWLRKHHIIDFFPIKYSKNKIAPKY